MRIPQLLKCRFGRFMVLSVVKSLQFTQILLSAESRCPKSPVAPLEVVTQTWHPATIMWQVGMGQVFFGVLNKKSLFRLRK